MEPLSDTTWDVVLVGTGLPQSLLALALSRSGKKVLHVDQNEYYGGAEAALSLQEAETWVDSHTSGASIPFRNAVLQKPEQKPDGLKLGFSRAYSLALSPHLLYTRSNLLPALVSSKVYRQLEFLAVGSWYYYQDETDTAGTQGESDVSDHLRCFRRIPGGREDVFSDKSIDLRTARFLMRFLKIAADADNHAGILDEWGDRPFPEYLASVQKMPPFMQEPLLALTLSPFPPKDTSTAFALSEIHRHLTSIGMFGPGFGSVIPKWGGLAEVAQVACRAGAVGGGVYVLGKGIRRIESPSSSGAEADASHPESLPTNAGLLSVQLDDDSTIPARYVVGTFENLGPDTSNDPPRSTNSSWVERSITIISSPLSPLFPQPDLDSAPPPACTMIIFPAGSLDSEATQLHAPIHLAIHSSDTGECPAGQCIIYAQSYTPTPRALLSKAVETLLSSTAPTATILLTLSYQHLIPTTPPSALDSLPPSQSSNTATGTYTSTVPSSKILLLPSIPPSFVLEDDVLSSVRAIWDNIASDTDADAEVESGAKDSGAVGFGKFMQFVDRPGESGEDEGEAIGASDDAGAEADTAAVDQEEDRNVSNSTES